MEYYCRRMYQSIDKRNKMPGYAATIALPQQVCSSHQMMLGTTRKWFAGPILYCGIAGKFIGKSASYCHK